MKTLLCVAAVFFALACTSTAPEPESTPAVQTAASDPRMAEMQTALTELLERIDVLNDRIARLEEAPPTGGPAFSPPAAVAETVAETGGLKPAAPPVAAEPAPQPQRALVAAKIADDYRQAIILFGRNRHTDARRAFEEVFESDPGGDLADNALFWIGETYFAAKDYTNAVRYYARVVNDYPTQNKAPDALFKTAIAQERTGDLALARRTLQQVIERYPYSTSASSANAELERIKY